VAANLMLDLAQRVSVEVKSTAIDLGLKRSGRVWKSHSSDVMKTIEIFRLPQSSSVKHFIQWDWSVYVDGLATWLSTSGSSSPTPVLMGQVNYFDRSLTVPSIVVTNGYDEDHGVPLEEAVTQLNTQFKTIAVGLRHIDSAADVLGVLIEGLAAPGKTIPVGNRGRYRTIELAIALALLLGQKDVARKFQDEYRDSASKLILSDRKEQSRRLRLLEAADRT